MATGFLLFPEEVWGIILENLKDSNDVLNLINAYPELSTSYKVKLPLWLIDLVFPHVFPWLNKSEVLSVRQTCKRWSQVVDSFLENHPTHRPIQSTSTITAEDGQLIPRIWVPRASPMHYNLKEHFQEVSFQDPDMIAEFLSEVAPASPEWNPFVGRSIELKPKGQIDIFAFWGAALELFKLFGKHIWFIRIVDLVDTSETHFWESLMNCLALVPNLKRLNLIAFNNFQSEESFQQFLATNDEISFPALPQLEALEINYIRRSSILGHILESCQSPQLRRLSIELYVLKERFFKLLPNLTELSVSKISSMNKLKHLMSYLEAPKLSSLELRFAFNIPLDSETEVYSRIHRFPKLESLKMDSTDLSEIGEPGNFYVLPFYDIHSSLKSLMIRDRPDQNYGFLRFFPSLEYLQICLNTKDNVVGWLWPSNFNCYVNLRLYLDTDDRNLYECNVWRVLPKLKVITLRGGRKKKTIHFSRNYRDNFNGSGENNGEGADLN